jgi:hypothetical protein
LGGTSDALQLKAAVNGLQSNFISLKQGGMISGVDLKPLSSALDLWNIVNGNWNLYKTSVTQMIPYHWTNATTSLALKATTKEIDEQFRKKQFESMASDLIASSDRLGNQLYLSFEEIILTEKLLTVNSNCTKYTCLLM